jgi:putative Holliday junction resolvase
MGLMGLDVGEKRIGVAIANAAGLLAVPLAVLDRVEEEADLKAILDLAEEHDVEQIVVGLPRSMDGSIGKQAEVVLAFCKLLSQHTDIPVDTWDERLSTVAAERLLSEAGAKKGKKKAQRDALAAAIVLQGYLDRARSSSA